MSPVVVAAEPPAAQFAVWLVVAVVQEVLGGEGGGEGAGVAVFTLCSQQQEGTTNISHHQDFTLYRSDCWSATVSI